MAFIASHNRPDIRYAWNGPSLLITDNSGRCGGHALTGYFYRQTRYLRQLELKIAGEDPFPCSIAEVDYNGIELSFVYPEGPGGQGGKNGIPYRGLDLRLTYRVRPSSLQAVLRLTNRWSNILQFEIAWLVSADYADLEEVETDRKQTAPVVSTLEPDGIRFSYSHPRLPLGTKVTVEGCSCTAESGRLSASLTLAHRQCAEIRLDIQPLDPEEPVDAKEAARRHERARGWLESVAAVDAPVETPFLMMVNEAVRTVCSLALLEGREGEWLTPSAGMPLYPMLFGRDVLTAAYQIAAFDRGQLADSALRLMQRLQGARVDLTKDEEPGRIIYQSQRGPLARLGVNPYGCYYADYASPFDFIFALAHAYAWIGDKRVVERYWDAARRVLDWARDYADKDRDGYLEYFTHNDQGPKHQGWKDSYNAVVDEDGRPVEPPIAACEVQAYYFMGLRLMAVLSIVMGEERDAVALWKSASDLKARFNRDFWIEDEDCIAFGLDEQKRQIRTVASNAGCFVTGILDDAKIPRLVDRLFQPDMFSGWGIRTLSARNPAFHPLSYHLGSVWPVENATIALGLRRYGFTGHALRLTRAQYDLALLWKGWQIPECVGGYARGEYVHPGAFPRANVPQTWNQTTFPLLMQAILGLQPVAPLETLAVDPALPEWLPEITLRALRVGDAITTLRFFRDRDGESHVETLEKRGTLHIVRQPPLGALTVGAWDRLAELVKGFFD